MGSQPQMFGKRNPAGVPPGPTSEVLKRLPSIRYCRMRNVDVRKGSYPQVEV